MRQIIVYAYTIFSLAKLLCPVQFPMDHLSHQDVPQLEFLLHQFAAFTIYGIKHFISFTS